MGQLQEQNRELETFSYSAAHDLRAPVPSIAGFSQMLQDGFSEVLDENANGYLIRSHDGVKPMSARL